MGRSSRLRLELARRPWIYWAIVAATALLAVMATLDLSRRAEAERRRWGSVAPVLVVTSTVEPGQPLAPAVVSRQYPVAMVPTEAIAQLDDGAVARRWVSDGQIVTVADVAAGSTPGSLARPGDVVVAVTENVGSGAVVGDQVMITTEGIVLADDALVVGRSGDIVLVAVDRAVAPMVAAATTTAAGLSLLVIP